jgi:MFS family permease
MATPKAQLVPTPLWAVLTLTFLGSLGTGAVTNGFSFIASQGLGYQRAENLLLALILGLSYIVGALLSGKIVRRLSADSAKFTPRGLLVLVLLAIGFACQLPMLAKLINPDLLEASLWALVIIFSPMTGILWPIVEGYLSGGRRDRELRSALGRFNIVWSSALVFTFWGMAPLLKNNPFLILSLLGVFQFAMILVLIWFPSHPPRHIDEEANTAPASYRSLLTIFRVLLIASYIVLSALSPLLPIVEAKLGIDVAWKTPIASVWLTSRVFMFFFFERWHGWHGRWWTPWTSMALMVVGFAACVGSPVFGSAGLGVLITGLVIVGMGIAMTYYGALYYAMAVGNAEVDAGGKHESMIGLGYTLGPLCGLGSIGLSGGSDDSFRFWVIVLISGCVLSSVVLGCRLLRRSKTNADSHAPFDAPSPH